MVEQFVKQFLLQNAYHGSVREWARDIEQFGLAQTDNDPTILFIDDDPDQLALFEALLTSNNYRVTTAQDGFEGLKKLKDESIDIVICDARMPGMSGVDFVYRLRKKRKFSHLPVIIVTAGTEDLEIPALQMGADLFCPKSQARKLLPLQIELLRG